MSAYRIMIVEDQREVSRLLHSALDTLENDLEVVEILSAEEAILDCSSNSVDLLVSDYRLPGMTGIELMHKVREYYPRVKVILITGQTDPKVRKEVAEAGADAFFIKPVSTADFLDAVERHLGLVETSLPPEPIAALEDEREQNNLPDLMSHLRQKLEATAVLLLNDTGRVLARAGDLPDNQNEISLLSSLLSIQTAGQRLSRLIGQKVASNWHIFDGDPYDLILTPVGLTHSLLVIGEKLTDEGRMLKTMAVFSAACKTIEPALGETTLGTSVVPEVVEAPAEVVEKDAGELMPLLKDAKKKLGPAEVDDFWDRAAHEHKTPTKSDMLSYDQAKQLGLAPKDES